MSAPTFSAAEASSILQKIRALGIEYDSSAECTITAILAPRGQFVDLLFANCPPVLLQNAATLCELAKAIGTYLTTNEYVYWDGIKTVYECTIGPEGQRESGCGDGSEAGAYEAVKFAIETIIKSVSM